MISTDHTEFARYRADLRRRERLIKERALRRSGQDIAPAMIRKHPTAHTADSAVLSPSEEGRPLEQGPSLVNVDFAQQRIVNKPRVDVVHIALMLFVLTMIAGCAYTAWKLLLAFCQLAMWICGESA